MNKVVKGDVSMSMADYLADPSTASAHVAAGMRVTIISEAGGTAVMHPGTIADYGHDYDDERANWIKSSDRLPEKRGKYACVVYFKARYHHQKTRDAYRTVRWLEFYDGVFWLANGAPVDMILWWMELPTLPTLAECKEEAVRIKVSNQLSGDSGQPTKCATTSNGAAPK